MSKVYIGVGHGGSDPGAIANGISEKNANLDVAKACYNALKDSGITVKISRDKDVTKGLAAYVKECNAFNPDLAVDIHHNAGGGDGAEVYHAKNDKTDDALAKNILDEIVKIGQNSRGIKTKTNSAGSDYFGFIRQIKCPSVLVECAFLDNKNDVKIVDTKSEREKMGIAIAKGILKTLNKEYKKTDPKPSAKTTKASFFPKRGYFKYGDMSDNVGKVASFMRKTFPSYTSKLALGNFYGLNLKKSIKEFQRRTGLKVDGFLGPLTLKELERYGFKK